MKKRRPRRNRPQQAPAQQSSAQVPQDSSILDAAEQKIESQLTPDNQQNYLKIVVAGMRAGLANGPDSILASLHKSQDPIADCAKGAIGLVLILRHQAKGVMPLKAMVPAATTLMLKALSFVDKSGIAKVGPAELDRATQIFSNLMLQKLGVTHQMLQTAMMKVHGLTQDPIAMEQMKRAAGVVKHPDASEPTPLPGGANVAS